MRKLIAVSALAMLASCADTPSAPIMRPSASEAVLVRSSSAKLSSTDPYWTAVPYLTNEIVDSLPVSLSTFGSDPESITDVQFESIGLQLVSPTNEVVYEGDGEYVEFAIAQGWGGSGGGGGGGGGDPEMMSFDEEGGDYCEELYDRISGRCRRLVIRRARAACWVGAMAVYAACRAAE